MLAEKLVKETLNSICTSCSQCEPACAHTVGTHGFIPDINACVNVINDWTIMSVKSKLRAREERKLEKRRRKAAQTAKYEAWKQAGTNGKSKRSRKHKAVSTTKHTHPDGFCGNPACSLCFPVPPVFVYVSTRPAAYFRRHGITPV